MFQVKLNALKCLSMCLLGVSMVLGPHAHAHGQTLSSWSEVRIASDDLQAGMRGMSPIHLEMMVEDERARAKVATDLVQRRVLAERAKQVGADKDSEIAAALRVVADRMLSEYFLEREEMKAIDRTKIEIAVAEEYRAFPERFRFEEVNAKHILVGGHPSCGKPASEIIEDIQKRIASGESFEQLARQFSDDKNSGAKGGDLGWIRRGKMVKPFEDALFALKSPGEISAPVETEFGVHLIQLVERKPPALRPFEEVKGELVEKQVIKARQLWRMEYMKDLNDPDQLKIDSTELEAATKEIVRKMKSAK